MNFRLIITESRPINQMLEIEILIQLLRSLLDDQLLNLFHLCFSGAPLNHVAEAGFVLKIEPGQIYFAQVQSAVLSRELLALLIFGFLDLRTALFVKIGLRAFIAILKFVESLYPFDPRHEVYVRTEEYQNEVHD